MKTKITSHITSCAATTAARPLTAGKHFIGIDYHKRYSVFCVLDDAGTVQERGRIDHAEPEAFARLLQRWPGRVVFEATMNCLRLCRMRCALSPALTRRSVGTGSTNCWSRIPLPVPYCWPIRTRRASSPKRR